MVLIQTSFVLQAGTWAPGPEWSAARPIFFKKEFNWFLKVQSPNNRPCRAWIRGKKIRECGVSGRSREESPALAKSQGEDAVCHEVMDAIECQGPCGTFSTSATV